VSLLISSCTVAPYRTFSSSEAELDFTFEYPSDFEQRIERSENDLDIILWGWGNAPDIVVIEVHSHDKPDAAQKEQERFSIASSMRNFELLKRGPIPLDGVAGYEFEDKFDSPTAPKDPENTDYIRAWNREIFVQRNGKVYVIYANTQASHLDRIEDFQHLVDTWKWK
jgi:hypothetical protein